jgi:hypothetical protein
METGSVGGVVAVGTESEGLAPGRVTSDVGIPQGRVGRGFVAQCTVGGGGDQTGYISVMRDVGVEKVAGSGGVGERDLAPVVAGSTVDRGVPDVRTETFTLR